MIQLRDIVIVSEKPIMLKRDAGNRFHSVDGPCIEFCDGYKLYAIHGRFLPVWLWTDKEKITKEQFINEKNSEIRAGIYAVLGEKRMMKLLEAHEIDKKVIQHLNDEVEIIKLFKTNETFAECNNQPLVWVSMTCPSTGTEYLISCEPKHIDAEKAISSLSIFSEEEYQFNYRS
jgi:hypothetical protein